MDIRVIESRLRKLNAYVGKLKIYRNVSSDEYILNEDMQAIVERRLQLAIQVCMDISNYIIDASSLNHYRTWMNLPGL